MNYIKTTVTIPEDLIEDAKIYAARKKTNLSSLIRDGLRNQIKEMRSPVKPDAMKSLGVFSIGIKQAYKSRADIYDDYLKRKVSS